jgi:broad specificity phosphatase PhoE
MLRIGRRTLVASTLVLVCASGARPSAAAHPAAESRGDGRSLETVQAASPAAAAAVPASVPRTVTRILLIRHAQSAGDPSATPVRPVRGFLSEPLGLQQAQAAAAALKRERIDVALASPYGRALQTAEIVLAGRATPIRVLPALREWLPNPALKDVPSTVHERIQRQDAQLYVEETWKTEQGEGTFEMYARMVPPFLAELDSLGLHSRMGGFVVDGQARGLSVAVFAHGGTLNVLLSHLLGLRPFPSGAFRFEETGLAIVELPERRGIAHPQLVIRAPHEVGR